MTPLRPARRAFTIIELLVVISIVAILAALILGALNMVRGKADASKCIHHLKQLGIAAALYAADNDGALVPVQVKKKDGSLEGMWYWYLSPYFQGKPNANDASPIYYCPTYVRNVGAGIEDPTGFKVWAYGLAINPAPRKSARGSGINSVSYDANGARSPNQVDYKIADIPMDVPIFLDFDIFQAYITNVSAGFTPKNPKYIDPFTRHSGKANCLFKDGHINQLTRAEINKVLPP